MKPTPNATPADTNTMLQFSVDDEEAYKAVFGRWKITATDARQIEELLFKGDGVDGAKDCNANKRRLLFIYSALHSLYGSDLADEWILLKNTNALFGGETPFNLILSKGKEGLLDVCRLLASRIA